MANPYAGTASSIDAFFHDLPQVIFAILEEPPQRKGAEVGHLDHAGQRAIDEQWRFNDVGDLAVEDPQMERARMSGNRWQVKADKHEPPR